ncbi:MAG: hypothetical protein SRB2_00352 [Desulfobacteraceae bacterium Eth-SRB2]|nr:MAG: hypothetical protein SRB2_00352 [Desulfobacteraceae bacterium Eth-SRB2]
MNEITGRNIRYGLTFEESKPHVYITDFSSTAWRRAYIKALFFENEKWIKCIEAKETGRILNSIVDCKEKHRTDRNLELQADLKDQIYNNLKYRQGYYEALRGGKPSTKFNKYLHPDARRFIQKYDRYKNITEVLHGKDRKFSDRRIFNGTVQHEQRTNRRIKKPKKFAIRQAVSEKKDILRRRPVAMVTR